jgi:hypothetical protein
MHPLLVKGKPVCGLNKKATREKYIYSLFMILEPYVGTPPRRRTLKMIFIKQNLVKAFGFTYAHESLLFYENLFYIRNQEDKNQTCA